MTQAQLDTRGAIIGADDDIVYRSDDGRTRIDREGRRTVTIRGQATPVRRRPAMRVESYGSNPDRAALWAVVMGVFMVLVALATGSPS